MKYIYGFTLAVFVFISACSPDGKPQGVLTDAQKKTLEKAKEVEKVLKDSNEKRMSEEDSSTEKKD